MTEPKRIIVPPDKLPAGAVVDKNGVVVAVAGQYTFAEGEPRADEKVYRLHEAFVGPKKMALQPQIPGGYVMVTFQIPGGTKDEVGLLMLKGATPPPEGTRIAIRFLLPEGTTQLDREGESHAQPVPSPEPEGPVSEARQEQTPEAPTERRAGNGWQSRFPEEASVLERPPAKQQQDPDSGASEV